MNSWPSVKACRLFAALKRIGSRHERTVGSHKILKKDGGRIIHSRFTIPRNLVLPSLQKSQKRRVFNAKTCEAVCSPRGDGAKRRSLARHSASYGQLGDGAGQCVNGLVDITTIEKVL